MPELPQMPLADVGLGLASAVLLLLAAFLLARSRADHSFQRQMQDFEPGYRGLFKELSPSGTEKRLSFVASLFLHILCVALLPWLEVALSWGPALPPPNYQLITLDYRMPLPPVVEDRERFEPRPQSEEAADEPSDPAEDSQEAPTKGEEEGKAGDRPEPPDPAALAAAKNEPAPRDQSPPPPEEPAPEKSDGEQNVQLLLPDLRNGDPAQRGIVLQPEFTAELPKELELDVPPVLLWIAESLELEPLTILEPTTAVSEAPVRDDLPAIQPQVRPPNQESRLSSLQIRQLTIENDDPLLTVSPADVTPLAGLEEDEEDAEKAPSITGKDGRNSLVVLSEKPDIESSTFDLEPGLRLGSIGDEVPQSADEPLVASGTEDEADDSPRAELQPHSGQPGRHSGDDFLIGEGFAELGVRSGDGSGGPSDGEGLATTVSQGEGGAKIIEIPSSSGKGERGRGPGAGGDPSGDDLATGLRPLPRSKYGIILVSNSRNSLPEAARVLSGTPVYTVHFDVPEAPRKWILQYCRPGARKDNDEAASNVIRVRTRKRVDPPYALDRHPLRLGKSADKESKRAPQRVVVYAKVTEDGRLERSRVIRGADPATDQMILANLLSWNFLPAFEEGRPVPVEAVFGIPLR